MCIICMCVCVHVHHMYDVGSVHVTSMYVVLADYVCGGHEALCIHTLYCVQP